MRELDKNNKHIFLIDMRVKNRSNLYYNIDNVHNAFNVKN